MDLPHASVLSPSRNPVSVIIRCKTPKTSVVENTARTLETWRYSTPLGSPTCRQKRSYVHVPGVTDQRVVCTNPDMRVVGQAPRVGYGAWPGGCTGWVIPRVHPASPLCSRRGPGQRSGPVGPCRGPEWWSWSSDEPARVRSPGTTHSSTPGASGARSAVPGLLGAGLSAGRQKGEISSIIY